MVWLGVYYLLACIISILNREPIAVGVMIGVARIALSLPGLSALTRDFSLFYQMRAVDFFIYQQSLAPSLLYGILVSGALLGIGIKVFSDRDFKSKEGSINAVDYYRFKCGVRSAGHRQGQ